MALKVESITELAEAHANRHPQEILALALQEYSPRLAIS